MGRIHPDRPGPVDGGCRELGSAGAAAAVGDVSGAAARRWDLLHSGAYVQKPATRLGRAENQCPCLTSCRDDLGVGRGDLSDDQWAVLGPLLPVAVLGRPWVCRRRLTDGIRRRVRTGAPWRHLPAEYGPLQTVYGLFRRWQRDGTWAWVLTGLQARADAAGLITWESTSTPRSAGLISTRPVPGMTGRPAQKKPPGGSQADPDDHGLGRSRGGWTTKVHLACEQGQKPLSMPGRSTATLAARNPGRNPRPARYRQSPPAAPSRKGVLTRHAEHPKAALRT
ncbi:transposase [Streptomyces sp. MZ04]|uniref:transposase n=1 Tax=Streptomyces sp. MZ04 TaxID=2559236 RepID=UPI001FD73ACD|nr:transposase [Streptomyces sp. MZ04]